MRGSTWNEYGTVETICRYPVKSMAGEDVAHAFVGFAGLIGDRFFAVPKGFPCTQGGAHRPYLRGLSRSDLVLWHETDLPERPDDVRF